MKIIITLALTLINFNVLAMNQNKTNICNDLEDQISSHFQKTTLELQNVDSAENNGEILKAKVRSLVHLYQMSQAQELIDKHCDTTSDELMLMLSVNHHQKLEKYIDDTI